MKFKFGDKVVVKSNDFYHGAEGTVISYDKLDDRYEVSLAFGCSRMFFPENLTKVKKEKSNGAPNR